MILDILVNTRLQASPVTGPASQMALASQMGLASPSAAMMARTGSMMVNPTGSMMFGGAPPSPAFGQPVGFGARASMMGRGPGFAASPTY